jgi:hypothetical protein
MIPTTTQSTYLNIQVAATRVKVITFQNFLTLWKILNNLAQIIAIVRLFAYDMHGTTSRSWLVKGQEVHILAKPRSKLSLHIVNIGRT